MVHSPGVFGVGGLLYYSINSIHSLSRKGRSVLVSRLFIVPELVLNNNKSVNLTPRSTLHDSSQEFTLEQERDLYIYVYIYIRFIYINLSLSLQYI